MLFAPRVFYGKAIPPVLASQWFRAHTGPGSYTYWCWYLFGVLVATFSPGYEFVKLPIVRRILVHYRRGWGPENHRWWLSYFLGWKRHVTLFDKKLWAREILKR